MDVNEVVTKVESKVPLIYIASAIAVIVLIVIAWMAWPNTAKLIAAQTKALVAQNVKDMKAKDAELKAKDVIISDRDAKIVISKAQYAAILKKYKEVSIAKANVKPAKTTQEIRDRFTAAGFIPVPASQHSAGLICFDSR